ncbi:regulator of G-protein signaling 18 isoform X2 [Odocoileus virginianus]|uniref:Regulator of G-protein signaling 18 isoform X2 n=1 Tax=Odocoileus virginianus TaxID=9874 RepID=A0ABM4IS27_ODOVR
METSLVFFSQLSMCEPKEKTIFKLIHGSGKEEMSKEAKIRVSPEEAIKWGESFDKLLSHKVTEEQLGTKGEEAVSAPGAQQYHPVTGFEKSECTFADGLETFTRFLKTEFSEENIEFWIACEDFKKSKDPQQIIRKAKAIYEKFIQNDAPQEVNLDFHTKEIISKSITQPTVHSFDVAQSRVYQLMEQDSYMRFLKSDIYLDLTEGRSQRPTNLRRRSRSFTYNEFQDVKSDVAIWL